jgi:hypothetical protein
MSAEDRSQAIATRQHLDNMGRDSGTGISHAAAHNLLPLHSVETSMLGCSGDDIEKSRRWIRKGE